MKTQAQKHTALKCDTFFHTKEIPFTLKFISLKEYDLFLFIGIAQIKTNEYIYQTL